MYGRLYKCMDDCVEQRVFACMTTIDFQCHVASCYAMSASRAPDKEGGTGGWWALETQLGLTRLQSGQGACFKGA